MLLKEKDHFIEVELRLPDGTLVGEAEVEPNRHSLERFVIFEPYQNNGYGTEALSELIEKYKIDNLWVRSDNKKAIHVYEKLGFEKAGETMFEMRRPL